VGRAWIAVAGIVAAVAATPAAGQWTTSGPFGGTVADVAIDPGNPQVAYALTPHAGVFKSSNGGRSWSRANAGLPNDEIGFRLEVSPADPSVLYVVLSTGLYRSTDGARSWTRTPAQPLETVRDLDLHPTDPNTFYLTRFREVVRSTDGGETLVPLAIDRHIPTALAIAPSAPQTLYGYSSRVYVSRDAGEVWKEGNHAMNTPETFLVDPDDAETVYAAGSDGLLKSTNGGKTFTWIDPWHQLADSLRHLAVAPTTPRTLYVGTFRNEVYRSFDGGASWAKTALPPLNGIRDLAVDPLAPENAIVAFQARGLARTADGGASWVESHTGLAASEIRNVAANPLLPGTVLAGSEWGVYRTTNGGRSWAFSGLAGRTQESFAFTRRNRNLVFAAGTDGIFRSSDGGKTWRLRVAPPEDHQWGWGVAIAPSNARVVYAGTTDGTIWRSLDGGFTWQPRSTSVTFDGSIAVDATRPQILWVGTQQNGLRRSLDGGRTWRKLLDEYAGEYHTEMDPVVIDPLRPQTVYVGWGRTIWRTTNNGATWLPWREGVSASTFVVDRAHPRTFYVQRLDGRILRTVNSGATWVVLAGPLPTTGTNDLALSADGKTLHASSWGGGVFTRRVR
jgi:photosystem II stability/assembly factor-like uncharacterized protein